MISITYIDLLLLACGLVGCGFAIGHMVGSNTTTMLLCPRCGKELEEKFKCRK